MAAFPPWGVPNAQGTNPFGGMTAGPSAGGTIGLPFGVGGAPTGSGGGDIFSADVYQHGSNQYGYPFGATAETVVHYYVLVDDRNDRVINDAHHRMGIGSVLFSRTMKQGSGHMGPVAASTGPIDRSSVQVLDVQRLNKWLCDTQKNFFAQKKKQMYTSAGDVLAEWKFVGILRGEVNGSTSGHLMGTNGRGRGSGGRVVNCGVGLRNTCSDEWSAFAEHGCGAECVPLYFIVKRADKHTCDEVCAGIPSAVNGKRKANGALSNDPNWHYPYVFVPYYNNYKHVPLQDDLANAPVVQDVTIKGIDEVTKLREELSITQEPLHGEAHRIGLLTEAIAQPSSSSWQMSQSSDGRCFVPRTPIEVHVGI